MTAPIAYNPIPGMRAYRLTLLPLIALFLPNLPLIALTPGIQTAITIQGVVTYTQRQTRALSAEANLTEYKATQASARFTNRDLIETVIGNGDLSEIKKWTLVGVRRVTLAETGIREITEVGISASTQFYLINKDSTIPPLAVPPEVLQAVTYNTAAETYTELWQGSRLATPTVVSGKGSFKSTANMMISLQYNDLGLDSVIYGTTTCSYKIVPKSFGSETHIDYVPSVVKLTGTGAVTIYAGYSSIDCVGEFTLTATAAKPVDLDLFR